MALGYFGYQEWTKHKASDKLQGYNLSTADQNPIPREIAFSLWQQKAIDFCDKTNADDVALTKQTATQCRARVLDRHTACERKLEQDFSTQLSINLEVRRLGKEYFACTLPKVVCNGVEMESLEMAEQKCK